PPSPAGQDRLRNIREFVLISALAGAIVAAMALPFVGTAAFATRQATMTFDSLPRELQAQPLPQRSYITANDGTRIATLYTENRVVVPLDQISPMIQQAAIATEDARFYEHNGVDLKGAGRALVANSQAGDVQQGSSTITMQYVRNQLITNAKTKEQIEDARVRTIGRKLQEMRYALAIEKEMTKEQILEGYLNVSYFGAGAYGVEAAAKRYFDVSASQVSLPQAATLAGLVQQPVGYDPTQNPKLAQVRRNVVLDRMALQGFITPAEAEKAKAVPIAKTLRPTQLQNGCAQSKYPFYCDFIINQIKNDEKYGATVTEREDLVKRGGFVIKSALDIKAQDAAQRAVDSRVPPKDPSKKAAAIAMVEPGTGDILAMAQNRRWGTKGVGVTTYNYAADAADGGTIGMQAGSVFKAFTLAAAFEKGISPTEYISSPQRKTFAPGDWGCGENFNQPSYTVNNSTGSGTFNMWSGTAMSVNTYFVELQRRAGLCRTVDIAERLGVKLGNGEPLLSSPSFTLGSMEVSPLSVAGAYAAFANHGVYCKPHAVSTVSSLEGQMLYTNDSACRKAVSREVADATTAILTGVIDGSGSRTGQAMTLGRDAAGKTGTTDSNAAVWFAGYTPDIAAAVWAGDPRGGFKYPMRNVTIGGNYYSKVHGSSIPGPIWRNAMQGALGGNAESFDLEAKNGLQQARRGGYNR
ncbi:MAG: transglycosylase domain-containing protein, partial [Candidatus Nanopelagicales bacterium]